MRVLVMTLLFVHGCESPPDHSATPEPRPAVAPAPAHVMAPKGLAEGDVVTPNQPTATEVAAMIARGYSASRLVMVPTQARPDLIVWEHRFDGVLVISGGPRTSKQSDGWHTRFNPEIIGPEPVRRDALITPAAAIASSGLAATGADLVYKMVIGQRQLPGTRGTNAMDFVQVVERYELVYRVVESPRTLYVDAYTGVVRGRTTSTIVN